MIQVQRSFLLEVTSTTTAASSSIVSTSPARSSLRLALFMPKLQSRFSQSYSGNFLPAAGESTKGSLLSFEKSRVACMIKMDLGRYYHTLRGPGYGSGLTNQSSLRPVFPNSWTSFNVFNQSCLNSVVRTHLLSHGGFAKRFLSPVAGETIKDDSKNVGNASSETKASKSYRFNKNWKRKKALASHSKSGATTSSTTVSTNSDEESSSKQMVEPVQEAISGASSSKSHQDSKVNKKKKFKSKKPKGKNSSASSTEQIAIGAHQDVQEKRSGVEKSGQNPTEDSEKNLAGDTSVEVLKGSTHSKQPSHKKGRNSVRKGKPVETASHPTQKQGAVGTVKLKPQGQKTLKQLYPPTGKSVLVVESLTKAKIIQGYLGDMYDVLPSYGHIRDLAARSGSVRPDDDFSMVWEVPSSAWTHLKSIKYSLSGAENLILASDPDREGEAIAWHIVEMLQQQDALHTGLTIARVTFHEITEASIINALQSPRDIDEDLVHAYLARRALDYLIGFNVSPLLWKKLPGCQSAGRVQSAALSLLCDREMEIDEFQPKEYWTIKVELNKKDPGCSLNVPAHLFHFDSKKFNNFSISSHAEAQKIEQEINLEKFQVVKSKKNKLRRNPPTPYITSTLQQDAANKLQFPASHTIKLARKLYEGIQLPDGKAVGLITFIKTDGLHISEDAVREIRGFVTQRYGQNFASESIHKYFKKVKNAQEAHEAIRPTDIRRLPSMLVGKLDEDSYKLYTLIWSRTVASQMEPSIIEQIQIDIANAGESISFRSSSSRVEFPGFRTVFEDVETDVIKQKDNEDNFRHDAFGILNELKVEDQLHLSVVELKQQFTQPPPRYSEGSLIKKMEELGIGRPSTYGTTLKVLQDRNYVTVKNQILHPEFRGRMVSAFLSHHFSEIMDYSFTADMETELDNVSAGLTEWKGLLNDYWTRFSSYCDRANNVNIHQVEKMLEKKFGSFLFSSLPDKSRICPSCMEGTLIFKVSRFGTGYSIVCDRPPGCKHVAMTIYGDEEEEVSPQTNYNIEEPKLLGLHPGSNEKVLLKTGPYGCYVQLGEDRKGYLPKRASVSLIKDVDSITLEDAIELLRYPLTLGNHPKDGQPVIIKIARVGFSVRHRRTIASVPKNMKPSDVTLEQALELLSSNDVRRCGRPKNKPKLEEAFD